MGLFRKALGVVAVAVLPLAVQAQESPVVVELYTSQGCSSCPPADEILAGLAQQSDVIALALHVDYWDYIGWKDSFGDPSYTRRQHQYAIASGARTVYTPQFIIAGQEPVVGAHTMQVMEAISRAQNAAEPVSLVATRSGNRVSVRADPRGAIRDNLILQLVRYRPESTVNIERGENAGRSISYVNIVTEWRQVGEVSGDTELTFDLDVTGSDRTVLILQEPGPGRIVAAARAD